MADDEHGPFIDLLVFLVVIGVFCIGIGAFLGIAGFIDRFVLPALAPYPHWLVLIGAGSALILVAFVLAVLSGLVERLPTVSVEVSDGAQ